MTSQGVTGQTYQNLWKKVSDAEKKDLPKTQRQVLKQIVAKAEKELNYGQLLKAELLDAKVATIVSPDSLMPVVERLKKREQAAKNQPLRSVYQTVIGRIYHENRNLGSNARSTGNLYYQKAMQNPKALADVKASDYMPFVVKGEDSRFYGEDLLSVIGYETKQFDLLHQYYLSTTNREAQLLSGIQCLKTSILGPSLVVAKLDSMIHLYGDLPACGEAAVVRYDYWMQTAGKVAVEQRIDYIDWALRRWGTWKRMNVLRNYRNNLTNPMFRAEVANKLSAPDQPQTVKLAELRNVRTVTMSVFRVNSDGMIALNPNDTRDYQQLKSKLTALPLTQTRVYDGKKDYEVFEDSFRLAALPLGVYMLEFKSEPETTVSRSFYYVSNLRVLSQKLPDDKTRYVVVNATTGQPVEGAQVQLSNDFKGEPIEIFETGKNGEYVYAQHHVRYPYVYVKTKDDTSFPGSYIYGNFSFYHVDSVTTQVAVFTDRAIYRPGQKVQAAAILYEVRDGMKHRALADKLVTARLRDANDKIVKEIQLTTDAYGTVSTDFTLPDTGLTGNYSVEFNGQSHAFSVEEYKRPTFFVEFPAIKQSYQAGDTLTVRGQAKSYAGVPVQKAAVSYTVERRMPFWWHSYSRYWQTELLGRSSAEEIVFRGKTTTDDDGVFDVRMPLILPEASYPQFYNFVVVAEVTDLADETRRGELILPLGNKETAFTIDMVDKMRVDEMSPFTLHLLNAAGQRLSGKAHYQVDGGKWREVTLDESVKLPVLKSGRHQLVATCGEDTLKRDFIVFSLGDKYPAVQTDDWFYVSADQFVDAASPVTVQVGSSAKNVHMVYTIVAGDTLLESGFVKRSGELLNRKFTYREAYGNGITLAFAWVHGGRVYTHEAVIRRPLPDKKLRMKWETFRDRLIPGQQEEWRLSIADAEGRGVAAQLMATLYDKSLDQIVRNDWSFAPFCWLPTASLQWNYGHWETLHCSGVKYVRYLPSDVLRFSQFDSSCFPNMYSWRLNEVFGKARKSAKSAPMMMSQRVTAEEDEMVMEAKMADTRDAAKAVRGVFYRDSEKSEEEEKVISDVQIRENMNETAFFYPQLQADSTGTVSLKFTLPESLTTWRFMGIAHTRDMMYGMLQDEAVAKKDVMIQPNMPRFVRVGDMATLSARIINTTSQAVEGTASIILSEPESDRVVYSQQSAYSLDANGTMSVSFQIDCSKLSGQTLLVCKMMAYGDSYSDGEQHYLPVLTNEERVTLTVPFTQTQPGTKTIELSKLFPKEVLTNQSMLNPQKSPKLTVEYTNNPTWLMIQALPAVGHPQDNCAICQAASLYANRIGQFLMRQNPNAKSVFESWKRESNSQTSTLISSLSKNEELKDLLIRETPWVMDADREEEQKQRLADFFDHNLMTKRMSAAVSQLEELQRPDGSWSWWTGMPGSFYMTVEVSEMLVRLNQMVGHQDNTDSMLDNAFEYMDQEIVKLVEEMKKQEKKGYRQRFPSHKALQYLYLSTLDGRQHSAAVHEAQRYLKNLLKKETARQTLYEKALTAIILDKASFVKSLKEYTVYREDMGRYYDSPRATYSWRDYRIPTQVAVIEAMQRLTPNDTVTIDQMRHWLLQEKRTQAWDTPINSADAIYAFLNGRQHLLTPQPMTELKVDGQTLSTSQATAGIGYVKTTVPIRADRSESAGITVTPHVFTVEKTSQGTSWGAVYAQYVQCSKNITDHGSELSVKRELLVKIPNTQELMDAQATPSTLTAGMRVVVRLTIEAKRDLDFVEVIDRRAACMEPVNPLSGYYRGAYCAPKDNATHYFYDMMRKGIHIIETEYYLDREGQYETGTCTVQCAYAPEFRATAHSLTINVEKNEK